MAFISMSVVSGSSIVILTLEFSGGGTPEEGAEFLLDLGELWLEVFNRLASRLSLVPAACEVEGVEESLRGSTEGFASVETLDITAVVGSIALPFCPPSSTAPSCFPSLGVTFIRAISFPGSSDLSHKMLR